MMTWIMVTWNMVTMLVAVLCRFGPNQCHPYRLSDPSVAMPFSFRALFRDVVSRRAPPPYFMPASFILTLPPGPLHNVQNMDEHT